MFLCLAFFMVVFIGFSFHSYNGLKVSSLLGIPCLPFMTNALLRCCFILIFISSLEPNAFRTKEKGKVLDVLHILKH